MAIEQPDRLHASISFLGDSGAPGTTVVSAGGIVLASVVRNSPAVVFPGTGLEYVFELEEGLSDAELAINVNTGMDPVSAGALPAFPVRVQRDPSDPNLARFVAGLIDGVDFPFQVNFYSVAQADFPSTFIP